MKLFLASMIHNLGNLLRFSGQDTRGLFWPYTITVVILSYAAFFTVIAPEMQRAAANYARDPAMNTPDFSAFVRWSLVFLAINIAFLAASVIRRLRDRGKPPLWALLPLVPTLANFALFQDPMAVFDMPRWALFGTYVIHIAGQISFIYLIVLLAGRSRAGQET